VLLQPPPQPPVWIPPPAPPIVIHTPVPQAPPPVMAAQAPVTGSFSGQIPTTFTGDRSKSETFLREFRMLKAMNDTHALMVSPYKRVILALSYMKGPMIEDWTDNQLNNLTTKTTQANNPIGRDEECLWTEFEAAFTAAFTNTTKQQQAYEAL
jgi:hypothetical protein